MTILIMSKQYDVKDLMDRWIQYNTEDELWCSYVYVCICVYVFVSGIYRNDDVDFGAYRKDEVDYARG